MNKLSFLFMLLLSMSVSFQLFSQDSINDLPNYTPPSPEAYAITQYGNQEINESTGKANLSVPIYNYKAGQLSVPISVNYTGNGVKVNAPNTWTGVNWVLNAGGVITRTVFHNPDEIASERIFQEEIDALNLVNPFDVATSLYSYFYSSSNQWDSQPDIFNFSFPGGRGSFYLNEEDMTPVLVSASTDLEIKIEGSGNNSNQSNLFSNKQFKITTPDGVKYFFGGNDAIEETSMDQNGHTEITPRAVTSFYLTEIRHPINGIIRFEYTPVSQYRLSSSQNRVLKRYGNHIDFTSQENLVIGECTNLLDKVWYVKTEETPLSGNEMTVYNTVYNGKYLSKIHSPNTDSPIEVLFNKDNTVINGESNFNYVLNSIEVINTDVNETLHEIDFTYIYDIENSIAQRFFLKKIEFNKNFDPTNMLIHPENRKYEVYEFKYKEPLALPKRFAYSQDALGYFNGKDNLSGFFPSFNFESMSDQHKIDLEGQLSGSPFYADRSTDFEFKAKGVLEKIYYPTGGHTLIEYESPKAREMIFENVFLETFRNNYPYNDGSGTYHNNQISSYYIIGGNEIIEPYDENTNPVVTSNGLYVNQEIEFIVSVESIGQAFQQDEVRFQITDITNGASNMIRNEPIVMPNNGNMDPVHLKRQSFFEPLNKDKEYKVEIKLTNISGVPMTARLQFKYNAGYRIVDGEGLRVKRISDFENESNNSDSINVKRYYYTKVQNMFLDPIDYESNNYIEPKFYKEAGLLVDEYHVSYEAVSACNLVVVGAGDTRTSPSLGYEISINPVNNFYKYDILRSYDKVTISYGGDNFENGGVEKSFNKDTGHFVLGSGGRFYSSDIENKEYTHYDASWMRLEHGQLENQKTLIKKGDTIYKVNETDKQYINSTSNIQQVSIGSIYFRWNMGYLFQNAWLGTYNIVSKDTSIEGIVNKNYIEPIPVAWNVGESVNPYIYQGWMVQDHDDDAVMNHEDQQYLDLIESYEENNNVIDESNYRKIVTTTEYEYNSYAGQPTKIITFTSNDSKKHESINRYVDEASSLVNLTGSNLNYYTTLRDVEHRVGSPIQTESYVNKDGVLTKLSTQRTLYNDFDVSENNYRILPSVIQTSKGHDALEDRVVFVNYNDKGSPTEVKYKDGSITFYDYNGLSQVITKVENYIGVNPNPDYSGTDCEDRESLYQEALVTSYKYDNMTHQIIQIIDPRCNTIYYEYDDMYRLKYVKDKDGNILSENDYNYQTQN